MTDLDVLRELGIEHFINDAGQLYTSTPRVMKSELALWEEYTVMDTEQTYRPPEKIWK